MFEHSVTSEWDTTFAFAPSKERLAMVWLSVSVAAANGGGSEIRRTPSSNGERLDHQLSTYLQAFTPCG